MDRRKSQKDKILDYLMEHGSITPKDAEGNGINSMRLAARISDLKKDGAQIEAHIETKKQKDGSVTRYARYTLI